MPTAVLIRPTPAEALERRGVASANEVSVLSCVCILVGHVNYHIEHLREHYRIGI